MTTRHALLGLAAVALTLAGALVAFRVSSAGADNGSPAAGQVGICHHTGESQAHEWAFITPDASGVLDGHGNVPHQDEEDIIPPFSFVNAHGDTVTFSGLNLATTYNASLEPTEGGQFTGAQILAAGCAAPTTTTTTGQTTTGQTTTEETPVNAIKVCKVADGNVTGSFTFALSPASSGAQASVTVPVGSCSLPQHWPNGTVVTVTEVAQTGVIVKSIALVPGVAPAATLVSHDEANGVATVKIGAGISELVFTNAAKPTTSVPSTTTTATVTGATTTVPGSTVTAPSTTVAGTTTTTPNVTVAGTTTTTPTVTKPGKVVTAKPKPKPVAAVKPASKPTPAAPAQKPSLAHTS